MIHYKKGALSFNPENTCGAVAFATTDIQAGDELLRDYGLVEPLPTWAKPWYVPAIESDDEDDFPPGDDKWRLIP